MLVDILIIVLAGVSIYRGQQIGFVRQLCSTVGFFGGLFIGALLQPHTVAWAHTPTNRALITLVTTLGFALLLLTGGEYLGVRLKRWAVQRSINKYDNGAGSVLSLVSLLASVWLLSAILLTLPFVATRSAVHSSRIITALNKHLPSAPSVVADLSRLINPNGFPQVFIGTEPLPQANVNLPSLGEMAAAVQHDKNSVVKVEGQGCGGIVEGSGFVAGTNIVATNAHVIAGVKHPFVQDVNGTHDATVIWFDPDLDFAVLRVSNLAGHSLVINTDLVARDTPAAVLGYPGGGPFTAGTAAVLNQFEASGRDIYGQGQTLRSIYNLQAKVVPGNSGGPLVAKDGSVIGIVFAESTTYQNVGYALTTGPVSQAINQAVAKNQTVSTGRCAQ
ncbi:MAG TPA: MarP family serine protease [Candidatus Saccharimonadales bacterium]|nr:MarP family serine protease [Candidatus Saccharimonadales bacterium]